MIIPPDENLTAVEFEPCARLIHHFPQRVAKPDVGRIERNCTEIFETVCLAKSDANSLARGIMLG